MSTNYERAQFFETREHAETAMEHWALGGCAQVEFHHVPRGWVVVAHKDNDELREYLEMGEAYHIAQELYASRQAQEAFLARVPDDWRVLTISNAKRRRKRYYAAGSGEQEAFTKLEEVRRKCERTQPRPTIVLQEYNHRRSVWENR